MHAQHPHVQKGKAPRKAPQLLPDDLYDYGDDPVPLCAHRRKSSPDSFDVEALPVIDDWLECVPVTEAEVDVFERYFSEVLDKIFERSLSC